MSGILAQQKAANTEEVLPHCVRVGQLPELNLDNLVPAIPQSFANVAIPIARLGTSVQMAAHAVEIDAQPFIGIIPRLVEEIRCGRAQRTPKIDRPLRPGNREVPRGPA